MAAAHEEDVMVVDSEGSPPSVPREASSEPCGPRRDSIEDADPTLTRKRQRLDLDNSPERTTELDLERDSRGGHDEDEEDDDDDDVAVDEDDAVIPTAATASPPSSPPQPGARTTTRGVSTPSSPPPPPSSSQRPPRSPRTPPGKMTRVDHPPLSRTSSKVTINVRGPRPSTPSAGSRSSPVSDRGASAREGPPEPLTAGTTATDDTSGPFSPATSSVRSPEVEIAEVEEMDQDYAVTEWDPLLETDGRASMMERFPFYVKGCDMRDVVLHIARNMEKGVVEGTVVAEIGRWIAQCVDRAERKQLDWFDVYTEDRDFWEEIPAIVEGLLKRRTALEDQVMRPSTANPTETEHYGLEYLFIQFARMVSQLIRVDIDHLQDAPDLSEEPDVISLRYQLLLSWILMVTGSSEVPLWRLLQDSYSYDVEALAATVATTFLTGLSDSLEPVSRFIRLVFDRLTSCPKLTKAAWYPLWIVQRLVTVGMDRSAASGSAHDPHVDLWRQIPRDAATVCRHVDGQLQVAIQKQASLQRDFFKDMGNVLAAVLLDVAQADLEVGQALFRDRGGDPNEVEAGEIPQLVSRAWKFTLMKKCITSGRMEVRVQALDNMCGDLVETYKHYGASRYNHPVMQYLAQFILKNKLVEYLVGVDSHLQLVERSTNIAGFLVVTHKYTPHESDAIWHVVTTNQDPRFVTAVLRMLRGFFTVASYRTLLYLCQKLNELPLRAFDGAMIDYAQALLQGVREKFRSIHQRKLDMPPFDLCIRLIRQATAAPSDPANSLASIFQFALRELQELLLWGPSAEDRRGIYLECVRDITAKNECSTGSICVINALLLRGQAVRDTALDLETLTSEFDLTRLVIEEAADTLQREPSPMSLPQGETVLTARLDLIGRIIAKAPSTIDPHLGEQLWRCIAENRTLSPGQRDLGWGMLCGVTAGLRSRNAFVDQCIETHLPRLQPQHFTPGVLSMAQQVIQYEHRMVPQRPPSEHEIIQVTGSELVWRIILTAPKHSIEAQAISYLVSQYLDASIIRNAPRSSVEATHLALVDRSVRQLTSAASKLKAFSDGTSSGEDEPMVIVATEAEAMAEELRFSRSLMLLREILRGMRERPHYSPTLAKAPNGPQAKKSHSHGGEPIRIRYQAFAPENTQPIMRELEIGDLETCQVLKDDLSRATGFAHFRTISSGREIDLPKHSTKTLREMHIGAHPLMLSKRPPPPTETSESTHGEGEGLIAVEIELLKHFDDLYELLGLEERLAEQIWEFLNAFPPQERIRDLVTSDASTESDVFPAGQPFKVMYSAATMQTVLDSQAQTGTVDETFVSHCVRLLVAALTNDALLDGVVNEHLKIQAMSRLIRCLLRFLSEPVPADLSATYFADVAVLTDHFMRFFDVSKSPTTWPYEESTLLACETFQCIMQASLHSRAFWDNFRQRTDVPDLVQRLVLDDMRIRLRENIAAIITEFCRVTTSANQVVAQDLARFFWRLLSSILLRTADRAKQPQSAQLFDVSLSVLRTVGDYWRDPPDLEAYVNEWGDLLMKHRHEEIVGRDTVDYFVHGFARLLNYCLRLANLRGTPIKARQLAANVFTGFLFPELSSWTASERIAERIPILHSPTRKELNELVLLLSQDPESYKKTLSLLSDLVPSSYAYSLGWNFQRSKSIRAPTGYVGLYNLSNTCYLNSLFTQLFMNVAFRGFMLQANVPDAEGSQKLLSETQKLFAYMQNSWQVAVEPKELAGAIRTYDNEHIDVTVQMDVDEFYNLLFDRWEGQILSNEDKKAFRSFYGGQLVQQVKSKECPHVSEREEPFSAIQCDIKGKSTLQESLKAYVEGDMMEGDNKYSCTSCDRHVDAVKRTCLKEVPDNLIFHLKRFDFDLRTMQRSKINDYFEFPRTIDMRPYKIEQLSDPQLSTPEDIFELVGVLVHSGTAESGHYYSFIRERPVTGMSQSPDWVQYNDSEVQYWNPSNIAAQCFGGSETWTQSKDSQPIVLPKSYSAYMLFYQRSSSIVREQSEHNQQCLEASLTGPKKEPMSVELSNHIALENELYIRKYCLYDEYHSLFVRWVFDSLRQFNNGACSEDHVNEQSAITMALNHLDQVFARTKEMPFFDEMISAFLKRIASCVFCSKLVLDWVTAHPEPTRNLLLRSPTAKVRQEFSRMIVTALRELRDGDLSLYGIDVSSRDPDHMVGSSGALCQVLGHLDAFWDVVEIHLRAWDDYFGLLSQIASLGEPEAMLVLQKGFLRRCLEILVADAEPSLRIEYERLLRAFGKGRKASYAKLIELIRVLIDVVDLTNKGYAHDEDDRWQNDVIESYPLTRTEQNLMRLHMTRTKVVIFMNRILEINHNPAAAARIMAKIIRSEPNVNLITNLCKTLVVGIAIDPASLAGPYLEAAVTLCEFAPSPADVKELIFRTAKDVDTIGTHGGREHIAFFRTLCELTNHRWPQHPYWFRCRALEHIQLWGPPLLLYWDPEVREETEVLMCHILFDYGVPATSTVPVLNEAMNRGARELGQACLSKIYERYNEGNVQVERKLLETIYRVINLCRPYFAEEEADYVSKRDLIMEGLRDLIIEEADEVASDEWDNDSNPASDSSEVDMALQGESTSP